MYAKYRLSLRRSLWTTRQTLTITTAYSSAIVALYFFLKLKYLALPWTPVALIGTALAFYLGFKNNSSYDRVWEGRKIWGGIVNASRSFTVMAREYIDDHDAAKRVVHRHVAWLHVLAMELRKLRPWEHQGKFSTGIRKELKTEYVEEDLEAKLREFVGDEETEYLLKKGNRSSHLLSAQTRDLMKLRKADTLEHFRHLQMMNLVTEFYTLQGKSERIKNFPLPRQYASGTFFAILTFFLVLPFGMLGAFKDIEGPWIFLVVPACVIVHWTYWIIDRVGEYTENPFEGLANDVPVRSMARGIEIDIRQMLDEEELPEKIGPNERGIQV